MRVVASANLQLSYLNSLMLWSMILPNIPVKETEYINIKNQTIACYHGFINDHIFAWEELCIWDI